MDAGSGRQTSVKVTHRDAGCSGQPSSLTHKLHELSLPPLREAACPVGPARALDSNPTFILHKFDVRILGRLWLR